MLLAMQGVVLLGYAVLELSATSQLRLAMGLTTSGFFALYGAGLLGCAWGLRRGHSWARGPAVFAQLIWLGVAWSFRGGQTTWVAVGLAAISVLTLAAVLHPASTSALAAEEVGS